MSIKPYFNKPEEEFPGTSRFEKVEEKPKVEEKSKVEEKPKKEEYEYFNAGESNLSILDKKFAPGDIIDVRPIPEFFLENGHVEVRVKKE